MPAACPSSCSATADCGDAAPSVLLLPAASLSRHLAAGAARLGMPDRDRLPAAGDLLAGAAAAQLAALHLVHGALHLARCFFSIPRHVIFLPLLEIPALRRFLRIDFALHRRLGVLALRQRGNRRRGL